jgi:NAD(P)-dependent dehydrogenase (short-subunit alcohol dehydrogenase family)
LPSNDPAIARDPRDSLSGVGRVAVVTGASSGIGAEIARLLAGRGDRCILLARRPDRLEALAEEIGGEAEPCDVSDRAAVAAVAARILERHPGIDVLVNNAGIPGRTSFVHGDPEVIERLIRINYLGAVWCLRAFLPGLRAAAPSGNHGLQIVPGRDRFCLRCGGPVGLRQHQQHKPAHMGFLDPQPIEDAQQIVDRRRLT